uniref:Uncharacterized protein n=1 Tax=Rhizophora mucronata TaxID=61149 RepID=A0A2P2NDY4_RHIMU
MENKDDLVFYHLSLIDDSFIVSRVAVIPCIRYR